MSAARRPARVARGNEPAPFRNRRAAIRWLDSLQGSGIRPGLDRMRALLRAMDNPHRAFETVVVAGTNGKGSTSATIASILLRAGLRTGLYTSPHLVDLRERWRIDEADVSPDALLAALREMHVGSRVSGIEPTYFEALTLLAFLIFRDAKCDVAVLEVGMGGRLDATNVTRPLVALISAVAMDHQEFLGDTIESIAREKAGVIHHGTSAVTSVRDARALRVIRARAARVGATLAETSADCRASNVRLEKGGLAFRLLTPIGRYELRTPLAGAHQPDNVALAVRGAERLRARFPSITREVIVEGVASTVWRGRLESIELPHGVVWVDGGHNEDAIRAIVPFVEERIPHPRCLVFGIMRDKDWETVASLVFPLFDRIILTKPDRDRGCDPRALARLAGLDRRRVTIRARPAAAVELAVEECWPATLVCGSLYLAGAAIEVLDGIRR
ncbi:MAG: bifunctional folylpolyglutamate synthase/dihydrofolate synthase [Thermoanaerobaculia bacterium]|nr:bifunctional folylpolyglutamate synthase/dihydrofolate synthase [Thermoanaerobaculia bacterium]